MRPRDSRATLSSEPFHEGDACCLEAPGRLWRGDRLSKIVIAALVVVLAVYFAQPYVDRWMFSASTPRAVAPRGSLSEIERTSIEVFERVSPSVVQVVGHAGALEAPGAETGGAEWGSALAWDGPGHILTT